MVEVRIHHTYSLIAGDNWEADLELCLLRHSLNMVDRRRYERFSCLHLERNDLERYAEYLRGFFDELAVFANRIASAPQGAADHLLAQQLRAEGSEANDVGNRGCVP